MSFVGFSALALSLAFYLCTYYPARKNVLLVIAVASSIVMGVTRVLVGAHYPIDVIAGLLLGFGVANVLAFLARNADALHAAVTRGGNSMRKSSR